MCCPSSQIGWYSQQREDTNISFASINLLWRVADYLARIQGVKVPSRRSVLAAQCLDVIGTPTPVSSPPTSPTHATQHSHSTLQSVTAAAANSFITSPPPNAATPSVDTSTQSISSSAQIEAATVEYVVLSQQATDSLMHSVFAALRRQATDDRSQVRNSAVKTLGQALLQHGVKMKPDTWYLTFPSSPPHTTNLVSISHAHSFLHWNIIASIVWVVYWRMCSHYYVIYLMMSRYTISLTRLSLPLLKSYCCTQRIRCYVLINCSFFVFVVRAMVQVHWPQQSWVKIKEVDEA
jgi:hypothetical protein